MWNWKEAVAEGKREADEKAGAPIYNGDISSPAPGLPSYPFWIRQVRQWNQYNAQQQRAGNRQVPAPSDQVDGGGGCTFKLPYTTSPQGLMQGSLVPISGIPNKIPIGLATQSS